MDPASSCREPQQQTDKLLPQSELSDLLDEVVIIRDFIHCRHSDRGVRGEPHRAGGLSVFGGYCHEVGECSAEYSVVD